TKGVVIREINRQPVGRPAELLLKRAQSHSRFHRCGHILRLVLQQAVDAPEIDRIDAGTRLLCLRTTAGYFFGTIRRKNHCEPFLPDSRWEVESRQFESEGAQP